MATLAPETQPLQILLVEDDPGDARLTAEALKDLPEANLLEHVFDGVDAIDYLRQQGKFRNAQRPDLVILDLNLPRKDGREVLQEVKADERLRTIPVVVFSTSTAKEDIVRAYALHANCYVCKPVHLREFMRAVQSLASFWAANVRFPKQLCKDTAGA